MLWSVGGWAWAMEEKATGVPTLLTANVFRYDDKNEIAYAYGRAEVVRGNQVLRADRMIYNRRLNVVTAVGNVSLLDTGSGQTLFAQKIEVTGDLKRAFVSRIGAYLSDQSRLVAQEAERIGEDGRYTIMKNATYSPCDLCQENPEKPPIWQMKATKVVQDEQAMDIIYRDAWLEMAGIPVFYTPYFSHPDPRVERRDGFISPGIGNNENIGTYGRMSYYYFFSPQSDITITPLYSSNDGLQLGLEQRQRMEDLSWYWNGTVVRADRRTDDGTIKENQLRGHLFGNMRYAIDENFRAGVDVSFASDKSYLYRYRIPTQDVLVSKAFGEYFGLRDYGNASVQYFQDIRTGDRPIEPFVSPSITWQSLGLPAQTWGGHWFADASFTRFNRDQGVLPVSRRGPNSFQFLNRVGWQRADHFSNGIATQMGGLGRVDVFYADKLNKPSPEVGQFEDVYTLRAIPQFFGEASYPLGQAFGNWVHVVEPVVAFVAAPRIKQDERIANETSVAVEFDETNIFALNRFTGLDRYEGGMRVASGVRTALYGPQNAEIDASFGRSYRLNRDDNFPTNSGLNRKWSDYVGRLNIQPADWLRLNYGFRLDRDFSPQRTEVFSSAGPAAFRPYLNYVSAVQDDLANDKSSVSELNYGANSVLYKYYKLGVSQVRALEPEAGLRSTGGYIGYADECFNITFNYTRDETTRPDVDPGQTVYLSVQFKNFGGFETGPLQPFGNSQSATVQN